MPAAATNGRCDVSAYLLKSGIAGTNIRSMPSAAAPILETIPNRNEAIAAITGFESGWFRVEQVETTGGETDSTIFTGQGWIHRSQLHVDVAGGHQDLRASPSPTARTVGRVMGDQAGVTLLACSGDWVQVRAGRTAGWLAHGGQCSNPLTTCP